MKKVFLIVLMILTMASFAFADVYSNNKITSNTVSFNTTGKVITFNSVVNKFTFICASTNAMPVYVTLKGANADNLGWNSINTVYILPDIFPPAVRILPNSTITLDFNTDKIGIITDSGSGTITYIATTDRDQP